jgi:hypothetical protein
MLLTSYKNLTTAKEKQEILNKYHRTTSIFEDKVYSLKSVWWNSTITLDLVWDFESFPTCKCDMPAKTKSSGEKRVQSRSARMLKI